MNQGLYGMASGGGASVRKLSGVALSSGAQLATTNPCTVWNYLGAPFTLLTLSAGVRTRMAAVSGRGALRYFASQLSTPATDTHRLEVWIDGKKVIDISAAVATASANGVSAVGWAAVVGGIVTVPDYIPFDSSCELFMTCTTGGPNTAYSVYRIDLHE